DRNVTGVQTCALPIYSFSAWHASIPMSRSTKLPGCSMWRSRLANLPATRHLRNTAPVVKRIPLLELQCRQTLPERSCANGQISRSEERRVGKECKYGR